MLMVWLDSRESSLIPCIVSSLVDLHVDVGRDMQTPTKFTGTAGRQCVHRKIGIDPPLLLDACSVDHQRKALFPRGFKQVLLAKYQIERP